MNKNKIERNGTGSLNENGRGVFDLSSTFDQAQREEGISKTLADEIAQNVQRAAQESIDTKHNPIYKLGEAVTKGVDGVIGSTTTECAKSPNNSPRYNVFKSAVKGNKYALLVASSAGLTARELQGLAQVTKGVCRSASKEGYRENERGKDKRNNE